MDYMKRNIQKAAKLYTTLGEYCMMYVRANSAFIKASDALIAQFCRLAEKKRTIREKKKKKKKK